MVGNGRPTQSAAAGASMASSIDASSAGVGGDWRSQFQPEARVWIVNKIMETLKRHLPTSVLEGINELREIAIWCEEKIYTDATTQSDYLRKISLKMLSMETKNPPAAPINPGMPNPAAMNQNPTDPASVESTAQTGHAGAIDWQEECYQKVKSMKELHFAELTEFHQKITLRLQQQEAFIPPGKQSEQHEKLKGFRQMLERMLALLQINKNNIPVGLKEKFPLYEKQILSMVASNRAKKTSPQVQGQQQFQHPNAGKAQIIPQQQQSQSMEVSEPASFQAVQEEPTFGCPICMCALVSPFTTVCGHIFCEGCIKAATEKQKKCPTCRSKLTGRNNIHRVFLPTSD